MGRDDLQRVRLLSIIVTLFMLTSEVGLSAGIGKEPPIINVQEFGAVADGTTLNTEVFQRAIDSCYASGAGTVVVPSGEYLIGTIVMKSRVTLNLQEGARLLASRQIADYRMPLENATRPVLIYANGAEFVRIIGSGVIDGQAQHTYEDLREIDGFIEKEIELARAAEVEMKRYYIVKPDVGLVWMTDCQNIHIEEVTVQNSSYWSLHLMRSKQIEVASVKIFSSLDKGVNADGIDINSCVDVSIHDCEVRTGDDAIVIKSWYPEQEATHIRVEDCVVSSSSTALKIGTESRADISDVLFKNCRVENSNRGLSVVVRDGATVRDVTFQDIDVTCNRRHFNWWGSGDPIWVYLDQRNARRGKGTIENLKFKNIAANGMGTSRVESKIGHGIIGLQMENVQLNMLPEEVPDKRATDILLVDNATGVQLTDVSLQWKDKTQQSTWLSSLRLRSVLGLSAENLKAGQFKTKNPSPIIAIEDSKDILIRGLDLGRKAKKVVSVNGAESRDIKLIEVNGLPLDNVLDIGKDVSARETIKVVGQ